MWSLLCPSNFNRTKRTPIMKISYHLNRLAKTILIGYDWLTVRSCTRIINGNGKLMSQCGFPRLEFVEDETAVHWVLAVRLTMPQSRFDFQNYTIHLVGECKKSPFKKTILWYKIVAMASSSSGVFPKHKRNKKACNHYIYSIRDNETHHDIGGYVTWNPPHRNWQTWNLFTHPNSNLASWWFEPAWEVSVKMGIFP